MSLLGLDVGTTGAKAVAFDLGGGILGQAYQEYPWLHLGEGKVEMEPEKVWEAVKVVVQAATREAGGRDPVRAIAVSSMGEGVTAVDREGNPLRNSIVSFDSRTEEQVGWWEENMGRERIFGITGMGLHPMYTINKVMWIKKHEPEIYAQASRFLCFEDFAIFKLCGEAMIDYSLAGRTMAFDVVKGCWSREMLEAAGIEERLLAKPVPSGTVAGKIRREVADELGLREDVAIVTGGHDQPCGALGTGVVSGGMAVNSTGTVECVTAAFEKPLLSDSMLRYNFCCYHHANPGMYLTIGFSFTGGSLLRWYRDNLGWEESEEAERTGRDVYEVIISKATAGPVDLFVQPHFTVTANPWFDPHSTGAILGLTLATSKGDIIKAMLEGLGYEMRLIMTLLEECGVGIRELRCIGGGAKSPIWLQLKADLFGREVKTVEVSEATCLGAAILAGVGIGEYANAAEAARELVKVKETYEPRPELAEEYERRFEIYRQIYPTLAPLAHRLRQ